MAVTPGTFWSVNIKTNNSSGIWTDAPLRHYLNGTPFTWFQYGTWTDQCNISANLQYANNGSLTTSCAWNMTAFRQWCYSLAPRCHGIMPLPGENNNSAEDAYIANWMVNTIGYQPDYFNIGNEPDLWHHYGIPWSKWSPGDHSTPSALAYAVEVRNVISAVRAVDPAAKFIGLEATCSCDTTWFQNVVRLDGPNLSAIAYHSYPSVGRHNVTLSQFLHPLTTKSNISSTYSTVRSDIIGRCASCSTLPIFLQEYNAGPGWAPSNLNGTYANALFLAASTVQALRANVTMFTIFSLENNFTFYNYSLLNGTDTVGPTGVLFDQLLDHLATGSVYDLTVNSKIRNLWTVLTENATTASVFIVNANTTHAATVYLKAMVRPGSSGTIYDWRPALSAPSTYHGRVPGNLTVPPEGIALVDVPISKVPAPVPGRGPAGNSNLRHSVPFLGAVSRVARPEVASSPGRSFVATMALPLRFSSDCCDPTPPDRRRGPVLPLAGGRERPDPPDKSAAAGK